MRSRHRGRKGRAYAESQRSAPCDSSHRRRQNETVFGVTHILGTYRCSVQCRPGCPTAVQTIAYRIPERLRGFALHLELDLPTKTGPGLGSLRFAHAWMAEGGNWRFDGIDDALGRSAIGTTEGLKSCLQLSLPSGGSLVRGTSPLHLLGTVRADWPTPPRPVS